MDKKKIHVDSVTSQYYLETAQASSGELLSKFSTSMTGLNEEQVPLMARQYGRNEITKGRKDTLLRKLIKSFANPFTVVLFIIAGVSYGTDVIFASPEERNYSTVIIIVAMVVLSGLFRFVQEVRSSNEAEKLKAMVKVTALVRRAGKEGSGASFERLSGWRYCPSGGGGYDSGGFADGFGERFIYQPICFDW